MKEILLARLEKIKRAYGDFKQNPTHPETTHQLRVNIRKLRGLLNFMKPVLAEKTYDALNQVLRETAQLFGDLRELDVLIALCEEIVAEHPDLKEKSDPLFLFLKNERRKEMARLLKQDIRPQLQAVKSTLEHLALPDKNWDKFVTKRIEKMEKKLKKDYEALDHADYITLHKTRIRAKKVRYAASDFGVMATHHDLSKTADYAEKIQDKLGKATDKFVNAQMLKDFAREARDPELQALFEQMQAYV